MWIIFTSASTQVRLQFMMLCYISFCFAIWTGKWCAVEELPLVSESVQRKYFEWVSGVLFWQIPVNIKQNCFLFSASKSRYFSVCKGKLQCGDKQGVNVVLAINKFTTAMQLANWRHCRYQCMRYCLDSPNWMVGNRWFLGHDSFLPGWDASSKLDETV